MVAISILLLLLPFIHIKPMAPLLQFYKTIGTSMEPTLYEGMTVIAIPPEIYMLFDKTLLGEIVIYPALQIGENYATIFLISHRVVWENETHVITKGDNNPEEDPYPIPKNQILGVVIYYTDIPTERVKLYYILGSLAIGIYGAYKGLQLKKRQYYYGTTYYPYYKR